MYYCKDCGYEFDRPRTVTEKHRLERPPFEEISLCPLCSSTDFYWRTALHCRCCGAKIRGESNYCSDACRKKGMEYAAREQRKLKFLRENSLHRIVRLADKYNKQNGTNLSYGQFVALVLPKLQGRKKNGF